MVGIPIDTVSLSTQQRMVRDSIADICGEFGAEYWRQKDRNGDYPHEFVDALADGGWFGIIIPEEYGGAGMGTPETVVMFEQIAVNEGGFSAAQAVHGGIYNTPSIVKYGSEDLKSDLLPAVADGDTRIQAFALTEPNAGSDSTAMETSAEKNGDEFIINGQKIWTSRVDVTDHILLMARTTPRAAVDRRTGGISMFLVDVDDAIDSGALEMKPIPKTASKFVHSYELWFDNLAIPADSLIGEKGQGFYHMLDGLNEERLVIAAECIGLAELAIDKGVGYATQREVFDRPIGKNQAIQHPFAKAYARTQAAKALTYSAADAVDHGSDEEVGTRANMSKFLAADAAFEAADIAVQAHGGFGVATEYDVERYFREARLTRLVPIAQELVLNYLGEKVLNLPRSY